MLSSCCVNCFLQRFPHLDHGVGVQLAVFQQALSCRGLLLRGQILDPWEQRHGFAAVVNALQIVIIQGRIIGEDGRQHALDGEAAAHGTVVVKTGLERGQQIPDVVPDVQEVGRKIRVQLGQLPEPSALEALVVGGDAGVHGDIPAQTFRNGTPGILAGLRQEFFMLQLAALLLNVVQGILEGDLLIGLRPREPGNGQLHGLEIQKIDGIVQGLQELPDALPVDVCAAIGQLEPDLTLLGAAQIGKRHGIGVGDDAITVEFEFLFAGHPVQIEHRMLRKMTGAVGPEGAMVRRFTPLGNILVRLVLLSKNFPGEQDLTGDQGRFQCDLVGHVDDLEQLLNIQLLAPDIV